MGKLMSAMSSQARMLKGVLRIMQSRTQRQRAEVNRLQDACEVAAHNHSDCERTESQVRDRCDAERDALRSGLPGTVRNAKDLNRYQASVAKLHADVSQSNLATQQAASGLEQSKVDLANGRQALRAAMLREEKWQLAQAHLSEGAGHAY
jgi:hypothetical protein